MKKKRALRKEFFISVKKTYNRFISICLIVMLGTAFFSGVKATQPDMERSADAFYDATDLYDLKVMSTLGMTQDDLKEIQAIEGVAAAEGRITKDVLNLRGDVERVIKIMSMNHSTDQMVIDEGRYPEAIDECFLDDVLMGGLKVGDQISIYGPEDDDLSDTLKTTTFTIVGCGRSSAYLSRTRGSSQIGSGSLAGFMVLHPDCFDTDIYTEIDIQVADAKALHSYDTDYEAVVDAVEDRLEAIEDKRCQARYDSVVGEAQEKIEDAENDVAEGEDALADAQEELDDARAQLDEAQEKLKDGEQELADARKKVADGEAELEDARIEIEENRQKLEDGEDAYDAGLAEYEAGVQAYEAGLAEYEQQFDAYAEAVDELEAAKEKLPMLEIYDPAAYQAALIQIAATQKQLDQAKAQLDTARETLEATSDQLDQALDTLNESRAQLDEGWEALDQGIETYNQGYDELQEAKKEITDAEKKLADAKAEIEENEAKYADGKKEYEDAKAENEPKIEDAKAQIADAKEQLAELEVPEWFILDRDYIETCVEYKMDSERIGNIGDVFPIIFFLVAALVSLTTMTRMVEEERTQIGTLKALGYGKGAIMGKYIMYAFLATLIGGGIGAILGQKVLPWVIMSAYSIMYNTLTSYVTPIYASYTLISVLTAMACTIIAVLAACYKELLSVPAQLMRPEAPKIGKRVWLEHLPFIWKHLSFSYKAAIRNLFRYKKRFFMTIIGIGGCMGLLMVGFGLMDSIMTIGDRQYASLHIYDVTMGIDSKNPEAVDKVLSELSKDENVAHYMLIDEETVDFANNDQGRGEKSGLLWVVSEPERMADYVNLINRTTKEVYTLDDAGVIITEKLAALLGLSEGDDIYLKINDLERRPVKVMHIIENYYYHYVIMTPALYNSVYGEPAAYGDLLAELHEDNQDTEDAFTNRYLEKEGVTGIGFTRTMSEKIQDIISNLNTVVYVIIIAAGLLAFVVLYNLNNINISERRRELATLKVLGFFDGEVAAYVFRENVFLTAIGALLGIFFGKALHQFVVRTAEIDLMMFGRQIYLSSYIYSVLLTFLFSIIVNLVMYRKLKQLDMIESMKSVE